ncbi:penicillin-binding protein 1C [SCandidatus Aminicenantes bacterium Aminicenantia_JdfR_composite]|jgi:penicillin-binding protein 1C|nr:penicillin-binding protein 1C [SCandidatus Aminicenantes bacterium Aminicenantia_JdfR_composite]MCP2597268.1 penicillin-binding protein 1C [Candidatus Aminicenantes bacterium AC-335-G13]MCP2620554.1 penicillin-binding protein 1C [Candidatus Aminicenantes bacterium AC-334-E05]
MKIKIISFTVFASIFLTFYLSIYIPFPKSKLEPAPVISLQILDREGKLLREVLSDKEGRCKWVSLNQISPYVVRATIAGEDKNFFYHKGIDLSAVLRAIYQNIKAGKIVSGGSTITQQVVRNIYHFPRNWFYKIIEMWLALRLENTISKEEILVQYLNRVYYGNLTYGIESASRLYFDKPASHLSLAESTFLAGIPRAPAILDPYRNFNLTKKRQIKILRRMLRNKMIGLEEYNRALNQELNLVPKNINFKAPHFCDMVLSRIKSIEKQNISVIQTTLDIELQEEIELFLKNHIKRLENNGVTNGAVIVMDNYSGEILSLVGSVDYFDEHHDGQVNGAISLRQPGSTLKPFTYGLALEKGMTPADIIPDIETCIHTEKGDFYPANYDGKFHGPVRLRTALACSYNIPALRVCEYVGPHTLLTRLHKAGFQSLKKSADYYGVGLTLGSGEVTLLKLCRAYSALARGGIYKREKVFLKILDKKSREIKFKIRNASTLVFSPQISYILTHILSDKDARVPAFGYNSPLNFPFPCSAKTGTSKDFRDNWVIGFTPKYTVGVWVGNFDGRPMHNVSGITGCGPLFRDIMLLLERKGTGGNFVEPSGLTKVSICPLSGKIPNSHCPGKIEEIFIKGTEPVETCSYHRLIFVDRVTGLPAGKNCPPERIIKKVIEVFPPLYHAWALKAEKMQPYLKTQEPNLLILKNKVQNNFEFKQQISKIIIAFPSDGDVFRIDPFLKREYQIIQLKVISPPNITKLQWFVDNKPYLTVNQPFTVKWKLMPGKHTFKAIGFTGKKKIESNEIKILVLS